MRNVLILEDDPAVARATVKMTLAALQPYAPTCTVVDRVRTAITYASDGDFDLIVSDYNVLDGTGAELLAFLRADRPQLVPRFVFHTGDPEAVNKLHDKVIEKGCGFEIFVAQLRDYARLSAPLRSLPTNF